MNAGWIVFDLGGCAAAAGPTSAAASATADALGAMPHRACDYRRRNLLGGPFPATWTRL